MMLTKLDFNVPVEYSVRSVREHHAYWRPLHHLLPLVVCHEILDIEKGTYVFNYYYHQDYGTVVEDPDNTKSGLYLYQKVWRTYQDVIAHTVDCNPGAHCEGRAWVEWNTWEICLEGIKDVT